MNDQHAPQVTEADVDCVRAEFLNRLEEKDFDNLESLGRENSSYQAVLLSVARASQQGAATLESIAEEYRGEALNELLRDLVQHDVLRYEAGAYRIVVGIYRDWLLRYFGSQTNEDSS
jgi:hypothetical protein